MIWPEKVIKVCGKRLRLVSSLSCPCDSRRLCRIHQDLKEELQRTSGKRLTVFSSMDQCKAHDTSHYKKEIYLPAYGSHIRMLVVACQEKMLAVAKLLSFLSSMQAYTHTCTGIHPCWASEDPRDTIALLLMQQQMFHG